MREKHSERWKTNYTSDAEPISAYWQRPMKNAEKNINEISKVEVQKSEFQKSDNVHSFFKGPEESPRQ